jgi:TatD DNase family protein
MILVDTHCHLNHQQFAADQEAAVARALAAGVRAMVVVGYDLPSSRRAVELAQASPALWATVGIHPHEAASAKPGALRELAELAAADRVVAVGEIGLDFYRNLSPRAAQERALHAQLELALAAGLPVVVHTRDSMPETLAVLMQHQSAGLRCVLHCWSGSIEEAERVVAAGWWLGIGGVVTFKKATELQRVAQAIEPAHLLLETDAPYLAPPPRRGHRNEPAYLPWVAECMAGLRGVPVAAIAEQTTANARAAFDRLRM